MKKFFAVTVFLFVCLNFAFSGDFQLSLFPDKKEAAVGEKISVRLIVTSASDIGDFLIDYGSSKEFEVVSEGSANRTKQAGKVLVEKNIEIVFFKTGEFSFGPLKVSVSSRGAESVVLESSKYTFSVITNLKEDDKNIKPLKKLVEIDGSPLYLLKKAALLIVVLLILAAIVIFLRKLRKRREKDEAVEAVLLSPLEQFERDLERLNSNRLFEKALYYEYFVKLSFLLRTFIKSYYGFNAEEMTLTEISDYLVKYKVPGWCSEPVKEILAFCDLVKFAKFIPAVQMAHDISDTTAKLVSGYKKEEIKKEEENVSHS